MQTLRHNLVVRLVFHSKGRIATKHKDQNGLGRNGVSIQNQVRAVIRRETEEI